MALTVNAGDVAAILNKLAEIFEESKDHLNDLDTKIGDGDHGLSMARGFGAVTKYLKEKAPATISATQARPKSP